MGQGGGWRVSFEQEPAVVHHIRECAHQEFADLRITIMQVLVQTHRHRQTARA